MVCKKVLEIDEEGVVVFKTYAGVAELADAYGSGPYGGNPVKVQVLSPAPLSMSDLAAAGSFFMLRKRPLK